MMKNGFGLLESRVTLVLWALLLLGQLGCEKTRQPQDDLQSYCQIFGKADAQEDLQKDHAAQMKWMQKELKGAGASDEFLELFTLAAPLSAVEVHNAVRSYANIKDLRFECSKIDFQAQRKAKEKAARIAAAKADFLDAEEIKAAEADPSYVVPDERAELQAKLGVFMQRIKNK